MTASGLSSAKVVKVDPANDLAVLKADGKFDALPVATSRLVKLGKRHVTVGFRNIAFQGLRQRLGVAKSPRSQDFRTMHDPFKSVFLCNQATLGALWWTNVAT